MNLFDVLTDERDDASSRVSGVVVGVVTNNQDPEGMGRVKVKFPWLSDEDESNWARVAAPMAGKERGFYFLPEVEDEVLVAFEHGDGTPEPHAHRRAGRGRPVGRRASQHRVSGTHHGRGRVRRSHGPAAGQGRQD